jgi:hypothetical protein
VTSPYPALPTFTDGTALTDASLNALSSNLGNLYTQTQSGFRTVKPMCVVYADLDPAFAPASGVNELMPWDTVFQNTDAMFVTSQNTLFTVYSPGWYRISLQIHFDTVATGIRACKILINGTDPNGNAVSADARNPVTDGEGTVLFCSALVDCPKDTQIRANLYQDNTGDDVVSSTVTDFSGSFMSAEWIAPVT